jgi:hypothetical protein
MQNLSGSEIESVSLELQIKFLQGYEQVALDRKDVTLIKFFQTELYRLREKVRNIG